MSLEGRKKKIKIKTVSQKKKKNIQLSAAFTYRTKSPAAVCGSDGGDFTACSGKARNTGE